MRWHSATDNPPECGVIVRVIYRDGEECNASRASGRIWYPQGSDMYRYVDVEKWRPLTAAEKLEAIR